MRTHMWYVNRECIRTRENMMVSKHESIDDFVAICSGTYGGSSSESIVDRNGSEKIKYFFCLHRIDSLLIGPGERGRAVCIVHRLAENYCNDLRSDLHCVSSSVDAFCRKFSVIIKCVPIDMDDDNRVGGVLARIPLAHINMWCVCDSINFNSMGDCAQFVLRFGSVQLVILLHGTFKCAVQFGYVHRLLLLVLGAWAAVPK